MNYNNFVKTLRQAWNMVSYYFPREFTRKTFWQNVEFVAVILLSIWFVVPHILYTAYKNRDKKMGNFWPDGSYEFI